RDDLVTGVQTCALPIFDSLDERNRVAALLEQYNHPPQEQASEDKEQSQAQVNPTPTPQASPKQTPANPQALASKATPIPGSQLQIGRASCRERVEQAEG